VWIGFTAAQPHEPHALVAKIPGLSTTPSHKRGPPFGLSKAPLNEDD
jgi:hypothetical protein